MFTLVFATIKKYERNFYLSRRKVSLIPGPKYQLHFRMGYFFECMMGLNALGS